MEMDQGWYEYKIFDCIVEDINELMVMLNLFYYIYIMVFCISGEIFVWDIVCGDCFIYVFRYGLFIEFFESEEDMKC